MNADQIKAQDRKIFEPDTIDELVRGWTLHAHKGRDRHDEAARKYEKYRYWLGGPTLALSAIVRTMMSERVDDPADAPAMLISHRPNDGSPSVHPRSPPPGTIVKIS